MSPPAGSDDPGFGGPGFGGPGSGGPGFGGAGAFWLAALACLAIGVLRDPGGLMAPPVMVEDGVIMLAHYHGNADPAGIFRAYNGYVSLGPNIVGYLVGLMPVGWAPYLLHAVPLIMAAATFAAPAIPGMRILDLSPRARAGLALLLCLVPFGNWALITNTTYMLWNMLVLSTVLVLFWTPRPGAAAAVLFALLAVFSWSHPLFVLLVPALAARVVGSRGAARAGFVLVLAAALAYPLLGVDVSGRARPVETGGALQVAYDSVRVFLGRGVFETVFSNRLRAALATRGLLALAIGIGALICLAAAAWLWRRRDRLDRATMLQVAALILYAGAFSSASVAADRVMLESAFAQRYTYPTAYLLVLLAGGMALGAMRAAGPGLRRGAALGVGLWLVAVNLLELPSYRLPPAEGAAMARLIDHVAAIPEGEAYCARLERGRWSVVLARGRAQDAPCRAIEPAAPAS